MEKELQKRCRSALNSGIGMVADGKMMWSIVTELLKQPSAKAINMAGQITGANNNAFHMHSCVQSYLVGQGRKFDTHKQIVVEQSIAERTGPLLTRCSRDDGHRQPAIPVALGLRQERRAGTSKYVAPDQLNRS